MPSRLFRRLCALLVLALTATVLSGLSAGSQAAPRSGAAPMAADTAVPGGPPGVAAEQFLDELGGFTLDRTRRISAAPRRFTAFRLDATRARAVLAAAPSVASALRGAAPLRIAVPAPDGSTRLFDVVEDSVLAPELAARHPEITSYAGNGVTDATQTIRLDLSPLGFHASVRGLSGAATWYVSPAYRTRGGSSAHLSFFRAAVPKFSGVFVEREADRPGAQPKVAKAPSLAPGDLVSQKVFQMAFVTEPSFATYYGGGGNVLAAKNAIVNRASQLYNDDMGIKFVLVEGSDRLGLNTLEQATGANGPCGANPCFQPDELESCGGNSLDRNNFVTGQIVGADTFDIGHFGSGLGGGGVARLGVVGGRNKASGCTALKPPTGDFYAIDFFAHEVGHQMGGNHTFNGTSGSCAGINRNGETSVEPGSGSSVQAYAGICGVDDLQPHTDPYFSQLSIDEINAVVAAAPKILSERQVVNLRGLDAGDTFQLTYPGAAPQTITQGVNYNSAGLAAAVAALTGKTATITGYDGQAAPGPAGFTVTFTDTSDVLRLGLGATTGEVEGFVGVIQNGGPGTNGGTPLATTNRSPVVTAPEDKTIPVQTPFVLTGSGTDANAGTSLTYLWEQNDAGLNPATGDLLASNAKTNGPLFRVFGKYANVTPEGTLQSPSPGENLADGSPSRIFPDLDQVLAGTTNAETGACPPHAGDPLEPIPPGPVLDCYSEFLPTPLYVAGELNFRLTARDGFATGGGSSFDDVRLLLDPAAGPFLVTSRETAGTPVKGGAQETITWDVAGTDTDVLARNVKILLSYDGGKTFPAVLAETTPNDGSAQVTIPDVKTSKARILIQAVGNYFFDVNDAEFAIDGSALPPPPPPGSAPNTKITGGVQRNGFVTSKRTKVKFASTKAGSTFVCKLDGRAIPCAKGRAVVRGLRSGTHKFTVAARDANGTLDPTPARRRFAVPFPARALRRDTRGWTLRSARAAFGGRYLATRRAGQVLRIEAKDVTKIALVAGTGNGFGTVAVFLDNKKIGTVNLSSGFRQRSVVLPVEGFARPRSGTVTIRTLTGKPVEIEGVGLFGKR